MGLPLLPLVSAWQLATGWQPLFGPGTSEFAKRSHRPAKNRQVGPGVLPLVISCYVLRIFRRLRRALVGRTEPWIHYNCPAAAQAVFWKSPVSQIRTAQDPKQGVVPLAEGNFRMRRQSSAARSVDAAATSRDENTGAGVAWLGSLQRCLLLPSCRLRRDIRVLAPRSRQPPDARPSVLARPD